MLGHQAGEKLRSPISPSTSFAWGATANQKPVVRFVHDHDFFSGINERQNHMAADIPAPPFTKTVTIKYPFTCHIQYILNFTKTVLPHASRSIFG